MLGLGRLRLFVDNIWNQALFATKQVHVGKNVKVRGKVNIFGDGLLAIGDDVVINAHIRYNPIGGQSGCIFNISRIFLPNKLEKLWRI